MQDSRRLGPSRHALRACLALALALAACARGAEPFDPDRFEKRVLVPAAHDPMQLEVLADGRVYFIERAGKLKLYRPASGETVVLGEVPAATFGEVGLLGLALDRGFLANRHLYLFYCPLARQETMRLSRFTLDDPSRGGKLDLASERVLLEYAIDVAGAIHMGGGMVPGADGCLYLGTGDNCPPIPELPVDLRPGHAISDALRSAANSRDLRGKVLRIRPEPDGSYSIPPGNLFADGKDGRPEIFAMGCRNPFRVTVDGRTGFVYWGDVGPNVQVDLGIGPNGYDEINQARAAGNFGWPMFVGPNEAYSHFDFATRKAYAPFDARQPLNDSPNNSGLRQLLPPQPAFIWYPTTESQEFPTLGIGARSAFAGPVYYHDAALASSVKLPERYDRSLFIYDWTRNWIQTVKLTHDGRIERLEPFVPAMVLRKPMDLELAADGSLYLIEYGDKWNDNTDAQIVRIVYQRGNRAPVAAVDADVTAGKAPLRVQLSAARSTDKDAGERLAYGWRLGNDPAIVSREAAFAHIFARPGAHRATVTVTDSAGAAASAAVVIHVGNAPPRVAIVEPADGSFFDWQDRIAFQVAVEDDEDGSTATRGIAGERVAVRAAYRERWRATEADALGRPIAASDEILEPGLALMRRTTCFSCHTQQSASAGPAYAAVAARHRADPEARERLARKIVAGGAGVWGPLPMPPHPQHTVEQTRLMVDWVLSLASDPSRAVLTGTRGSFRTRAKPEHRSDAGVYVITATYTDRGSDGAPPLTGEAQHVLHSRRKKAAYFDARRGVEVVDDYEGENSLVAWFAPGDHVSFARLRLDGVTGLTLRVAAAGTAPGAFEVRLDAPTGLLLCRVDVPPRSGALAWSAIPAAVPATTGVHEFFVVATAAPGAAGRTLGLNWIDFELPRPPRPERARIVLVPTRPDHPWGTHMYAEGCALLEKLLNQHDGVDAIVSPDFDWPKDPEVLKGARAVVYYSRPAGDIVLGGVPGGPAREEARRLFASGAGFVAIHWATAADRLELGPAYLDLLGGWFNFAHSGIKVDTRPLVQLDPAHPICRGWQPYDLRDEFYLNLKFHPRARPLLQVEVDGKPQVVAWTHEREDGGRSFGTTLAHFHDNFAIEAFRRAIVNGILWAAKVEVPPGGAAVEVTPADLRLPPPPRAPVKEWRVEDLAPALAQAGPPRSLERGKLVFDAAGCVTCHRLGHEGGDLGPELTTLPGRLAERKWTRLDLLRELLEPSRTIEDRYRVVTLVTRDGGVHSGIVVAEDAAAVRVAFNPAAGADVREIAAGDIESRAPSDVSLMPAGLLTTFREDEILDLLGYLESGGGQR